VSKGAKENTTREFSEKDLLVRVTDVNSHEHLAKIVSIASPLIAASQRLKLTFRCGRGEG
jgi:hypothetical protein